MSIPNTASYFLKNAIKNKENKRNQWADSAQQICGKICSTSKEQEECVLLKPVWLLGGGKNPSKLGMLKEF